MTKHPLRTLRVHPLPGQPMRGMIQAGTALFPCALGRAGIGRIKREGDGKTPLADLPLRQVFYRKDRRNRPKTLISGRATRTNDAWCDDPSDNRYNRLIRKPPGTAEECLTRADGLYDCIVTLGWNDAPVQKRKGSAIFWHIARPGFTPTAGCVAVTRDVFDKILPRLARKSIMKIKR
jgi:L,D-peptidoglycan transpeptidase YkuD (ErfK/YbiS/YcfS/YnhG family)